MEMNYCRRCGTSLAQLDRHVYQCANGHIIFANCSPAVGVFLVTPDHQVIFSVRGIEPHKGMLDAFGGFLDGEETFEAAASRELEGEVLLKTTDYGNLGYLTSGVGHYPYKNETLPVVSLLFWARVDSAKVLTPSDDVEAVKKIPLHKIDLALLHDDDIRAGIQELQRQLAPAKL